MDLLRHATDGYADAWGRGDGRTRLALALGVALGTFLAGAFLFGAWHIVVGGLVKGNPRAAAFGVGLAAVSGVLLVVLRYVGRRTALRQPPSA
jgi:hypothetical protein